MQPSTTIRLKNSSISVQRKLKITFGGWAFLNTPLSQFFQLDDVMKEAEVLAPNIHLTFGHVTKILCPIDVTLGKRKVQREKVEKKLD